MRNDIYTTHHLEYSGFDTFFMRMPQSHLYNKEGLSHSYSAKKD